MDSLPRLRYVFHHFVFPPLLDRRKTKLLELPASQAWLFDPHQLAHLGELAAAGFQDATTWNGR
jgi:hypothetical protein